MRVRELAPQQLQFTEEQTDPVPSVQHTKILEMKLSQPWGMRAEELSYMPPKAKREGPEHSRGKTENMALVVWVTWTKGLGTKELSPVRDAACVGWAGWGKTEELTEVVTIWETRWAD